MKRFGLWLTMVIMSSLPVVLMFAHAAAGSADDEEKNGPTARPTKIVERARKTPLKDTVTKATPLKDTVTNGTPSATRAPNPTKRPRKTTGTLGPAAGGAGAGKVNGLPTIFNNSDVVCTGCPSPPGKPKKHDGHGLGGPITPKYDVPPGGEPKPAPNTLQCKRCPPIPTDSNVKSTAPHKRRK